MTPHFGKKLSLPCFMISFKKSIHGNILSVDLSGQTMHNLQIPITAMSNTTGHDDH